MAELPGESAPAPEILQLQDELARLKKINRVLMARVEGEMDERGSDFSLFQTSVVLENQVRERTRELESALAEQKRLILRLEEAHSQLLHAEKMASIGQLAAGVAHEINNPIGFVSSNLQTLLAYVTDLMGLIALYEAHEPLLREHAADAAAGIQRLKEQIDLEFLREDIVTLISESKQGADRVKRIVKDLRDFSRPGEEAWQWLDLRSGLDSTLNMMGNEIRDKADILKEYGDIPQVLCLASQLNQVFMNLLLNAAQAIENHGRITLRTGHVGDEVYVAVSDTGAGIPPEIIGRIFDPFFTTRKVGSGTGLGLSVSYGIVKKHGGRIEVKSAVGKGSTFTVWLPVKKAA